MGIGRFRDRNAAHDCCAEPVFVMAGNPNVGKSSLFNALTGLHQPVSYTHLRAHET